MVSPTWVETFPMQHDLEDIVAREGKGRNPQQAIADFAAAHPQKRVLQPGEVADLVTFPCSDAARRVTMENIQIKRDALW